MASEPSPSADQGPTDRFIPVSYSTNRRRDRFFRSKPKAAYIAVSCDIYLMSRIERGSVGPSDAPTSFADFRGAFRYDLQRGESAVETYADENPCALRVTAKTASSSIARAKPVSIKIVCESVQKMLEVSSLINLAAMPLVSLQTSMLTQRRQTGADLEQVRALLAKFRSSTHTSSHEVPHESPGLNSIVTHMTNFAQASKGTARAFRGAGEWAEAVGGVVASTRGAITVLEKVFGALPIAAPVAQVLGLAADVAVLTVERSEKEREMKDLAPRCQAIAKDVVQALFFCLDYAAVEDSVVEKLFLVLGKCCHVARLAEQFVMQTRALQFFTIEDVSTVSAEVKDIESHVTSLRILQYVQENHARNQRADKLDAISAGAGRGDSFRRVLIVSPASVSATMNFEESSETPESKLKAKLFDETCTSGLVGALGMTGVGKTAILA